MISPAIKRLGAVLRSITGNGDPGKVVALAREFGIDGRAARDVAKGRVISTDSYLRLCGAVGIDPLTGEPCDRARIAELDLNRFATKILLFLLDSNRSMRFVAQSWGIALVILGRAKAEQHVNVENFLKICRGLGCHPREFQRFVPVPVTQKQSPEHIDNTSEAIA